MNLVELEREARGGYSANIRPGGQYTGYTDGSSSVCVITTTMTFEDKMSVVINGRSDDSPARRLKVSIMDINGTTHKATTGRDGRAVFTVVTGTIVLKVGTHID